MSKIFLKIINLILVSLISTLIAVPCFAAPLYNSDLQARITLDTNLKPDNSPGVIIDPASLTKSGGEAAYANYILQMLAGALISIAAPVAIIIIAVAGLIAVVSHGDQGLIDKAKKTLVWAVIGLIVIIFSWVIIRTVVSLVLTANVAPTTTTNSSTAPNSSAGTGGAQGGAPVTPPPS